MGASNRHRMQAKNVDVFDRDAERNEGYYYTQSSQLSCRLATQTSTEAILATKRLRDRSVLDLGCGDGFYTIRFWDQGGPKAITGIDPARQAIAVANRKKGNRPLHFEVGDAHRLPYADDTFDLALIQSSLHHDDNPRNLIREAFRVAPEILIHEPNGNNPGLKLIEKLSRYHRDHNEKSYTSRRIVQWINETGGSVTYIRFAGFVPMFCPTWIAVLMKGVEPIVAALPFLSHFLCAVTVIGARRLASPDNALT